MTGKIVLFTSRIFFVNFCYWTTPYIYITQLKKLTFSTPTVFRHTLILIITFYEILDVAILFALRWFPTHQRDRLVMFYNLPKCQRNKLFVYIISTYADFLVFHYSFVKNEIAKKLVSTDFSLIKVTIFLIEVNMFVEPF